MLYLGRDGGDVLVLAWPLTASPLLAVAVLLTLSTGVSLRVAYTRQEARNDGRGRSGRCCGQVFLRQRGGVRAGLATPEIRIRAALDRGTIAIKARR